MLWTSLGEVLGGWARQGIGGGYCATSRKGSSGSGLAMLPVRDTKMACRVV